MTGPAPDLRFQRRLVDALYTDAMLLADEARSYFEDRGRVEREALSPYARVAFSCESLKVTTRLMHIVAWLLTRRAVAAGELTEDQAAAPSRRLGPAPAVDPAAIATLPAEAAQLVAASVALFQRAHILDRGAAPPAGAASPALAMQQDLFARLGGLAA